MNPLRSTGIDFRELLHFGLGDECVLAPVCSASYVVVDGIQMPGMLGMIFA